MKEQLISLKTAKLAKKKGFDILCPYWFGCDNPSGGHTPNKPMCTPYNITDLDGRKSSQKGTRIYSRPTQSLLQTWLRNEHNIKVYLTWYDDIITEPRWSIYVNRNYINGDTNYEKALEIGLYEALTLIDDGVS